MCRRKSSTRLVYDLGRLDVRTPTWSHSSVLLTLGWLDYMRFSPEACPNDLHSLHSQWMRCITHKPTVLSLFRAPYVAPRLPTS